MTVNTVGDETNRNPIVGPGAADAPRRSVLEWRHRVVEVSRHLGPGAHPRGELLQGGVGMTQADLDPTMPQAMNPVQTTRLLRREGHQSQPAAFQQLIEQ